MLQTGCPIGDGTGGESIWGGTFKDEIVGKLRFDRPYTVAMANCGPGTNGSQFFITTGVADHLDGVHTIFGRVLAGMDVVNMIDTVPVRVSPAAAAEAAATNEKPVPSEPIQEVKMLAVNIH